MASLPNYWILILAALLTNRPHCTKLSDYSLYSYRNIAALCYGDAHQNSVFNHVVKNDVVLQSVSVKKHHTIDMSAKDGANHPHSNQLRGDFQSSFYSENCTQERIEIFFGDYLQLHNVNSMKVGKFDDDTSIFNDTRLSFGRTFDATILHSYTIDFDIMAVISSTPVKQRPLTT